ncbi:virulence factor family protein [Rhizobium halophytocola]|uniref:Type IV secretory pathway VirJ component n=1 Tax=Rhizobium halophytocola TaxID=735519 RepID=A0ABS4E283_9HYPH|nr:virulence factor family protein [Rhizobium halophytocola]MBP1852057.1 type IV secretory pathway VirJ component [Rhizobium halophytocola]
MKNLLTPIILGASLMAMTVKAEAQTPAPTVDAGMIPSPTILMPDGAPKGFVVLLSDKDGWQDEEQSEAERLQKAGSIVLGIDTPNYLKALSKDDGDCIYTVSDIEDVSHQLQRQAGATSYIEPVVAGRGAGGALALAILSQTPAATFDQTLVVDPEAGIPLLNEFCTPAEKTIVNQRMLYGLTDGDLPDPLTAVFTPSADKDGRAHVVTLTGSHPDIDISDTKDDARTAFDDEIDAMIVGEDDSDSPLGLPLSVLDATPQDDIMAVILSGDGGWRDIDSEIGDTLQKRGVPVVGLDSLHYFWQKRTAEETAKDLARIISTYQKRWHVHHVVLIGYSFGADVLPASYNRLPEKLQASVAQMSLLALSHQIDYEVSVTGWLGAGDKGEGDPLDDIKSIKPSLIQCIYGTDDDEDACRDLKAKGVETIEIDGGHHFDGDYEGLAGRILSAAKKRIDG